MRRSQLLLGVFGGLVGLIGCSEVAAPPAPAPTQTLALQPCRVKGIDTEVKCATLDVFENPTKAVGRKIGINVVVLPATARIKHPDPVFIFAGGPGQAASDLALQALGMLSGLTNKRDVVLIDQRGTGKSNPLNCPSPDPKVFGAATSNERERLSRALYKECLSTLEKRADLTQYSTSVAMGDYNAVRQALGYQQINLWGGSYGTRAALEYLRQYPESVRSVVLDSVAAPNLALPREFARDAGAALSAVVGACDANARCKKAYPQFGAELEALLETLRKAPVRRDVADPKSGLLTALDVSRESVLMAIFSALYSPSTAALLPEAVAQAREGRYGALNALSAGFNDFAEEKMAMGMRLSVSCAEDVDRISEADLNAAEKHGPFGGFFIREFRLACEGWPRSQLSADFGKPVVSPKPVLIYSGGLDPVTPPIWGAEVAKSLSNSLHVVSPNIGHISSGVGCASKITKQFIDKATVAGLDPECLRKQPRPSFYEPMQERTKKTAPETATEGAAK